MQYKLSGRSTAELMSAANAGDVAALCELGEISRRKIFSGEKRNMLFLSESAARMYFTKATEEESVALMFFTMAAKAGSMEAMLSLGDLLVAKGFNRIAASFVLSKDYNELKRYFGYDKEHGEEYLSNAIKWYTQAAEAGNDEAMYKLGELYGIQIHFNPEDNTKGTVYSAIEADDDELIHKDNTSGLSVIEFRSNFEYLFHDENESQKWYSRAAEMGNSDAMLALGRKCKGRREFSEALQWFTRAAQAGKGIAMRELSALYQEKIDGIQDLDKAVEWLIRAADAGVSHVAHKLGSFYYQETKKDRVWECLLRKAETGDAEAMCLVGLIYYNHSLFRYDSDEAMKLYAKAMNVENKRFSFLRLFYRLRRKINKHTYHR